LFFCFSANNRAINFPDLFPAVDAIIMNKKNNKSWRSVSQEIFQSFLKKQKN